MGKGYEINFTQGKIMKPLLLFAVPLMLSGMLQLFYNATATVVVGRFSGSESLAAVGSTGSLINLLTNIFLGLSVGANVLISKRFGMNDKILLERAVHTTVLLSLIGGVIFGVIGIIFVEPILVIMGTPAEVLPKAALYMKVYFLGMPAVAVYNFGSAILRAVGDTKRPLFFLVISSSINIMLSLLFVVRFKLDVAGAGLSVVAAQTFSSVMIIVCLVRSKSTYKLVLKNLRICKKEFVQILKVGLPAGIQSSLFSLSTVIIQSSINSFGGVAMAGNSAGTNIEGFAYIAMNSIYHTSLTYSAQNHSVKDFDRIKKGAFYCVGLVAAAGLVLGNVVVFFSEQLMGIYSSDPQVIQIGMGRLAVICSLYFLCGIMEVGAGLLRGLSYSIMPMFITLIGACGLRIVWIYTVLVHHRSLNTIYLVYPVSWGLTALALLTSYVIVFKKLVKRYKADKNAVEALPQTPVLL